MNRTRTSKNAKRLLVWLLLLTMVFGLLPMAAFADETVVEPVVSEEPVQEPVEEQSDESAPVEPEEPEEPSVEPEEPEEPTDVIVIDGDELPEDELDTLAAEEGVISEDAIPEPSTTELPTAATKSIRAVMLDCGRKYFTVGEIEALIDAMVKYGYNQLQLSFGNGGCRFLLNEMTLKFKDSDGTTVTINSDSVKTNIKNGNVQFNGDGSTLSQSEMDTIISYAQANGISIVPMLNMPGHSTAIMCGYDEYQSTKEKTNGNLDVDNLTARNYGYALLSKYVDYFALKDCKYFSFGSDESGFDGNGMTSFVTGCAKIIANAGMRPRAFNDATNVATYPAYVQISYWHQESNSKNPTELANDGHEMLNTHGRWYYVIKNEQYDSNRDNKYWTGQVNSAVTSVELPATKVTGLDDGKWTGLNEYFTADPNYGTVVGSSVGTMFCIWCDASQNTYLTGEQVLSYNENYGALYQLQKLAEHYWPEAIKEPTTPDIPEPGTGEKKTINLTVGQTSDEITVDGDYSAAATGDNYVATVAPNVTTVPGKTTYVRTSLNDTSVENKTFYVYDKDTLGTANPTETLMFEDADSGKADSGKYYYIKNSAGKYIYPYNNSVKDTTRKNTTVSVSSDVDSGYTISYTYYYYLGYKTSYLTVTSEGLSASSSPSKIYLYKPSTTEPTPQTTFSFTGTGEGTTTATIAGVTYTINVTAPNTSRTVNIKYGETYQLPAHADITVESGEQYVNVNSENGVITAGETSGTAVIKAAIKNDGNKITESCTYTVVVSDINFEDIEPLPVELWITNFTVGIEADDIAKYDTSTETRTSGSDSATVTTVKIAAKDAYKEGGVLLSTLIPQNTYKSDNNSVKAVYWKGSQLSEKPQPKGGDLSTQGSDFTYIRYWNSTWQYKNKTGEWVDLNTSGNNTVVGYYLQINNVSPEITTGAQHYGEPPTNHPGSSGNGFTMTAFAVVYPDGTLSRTEPEMYRTSIIRGYWGGTSIGIGVMYAENNSDYVVSKMTLTWGENIKGASDGSSWFVDSSNTDEKYGSSWGVSWDKKTNAAGKEWYDETTYWEKGDSDIPMIDGNAENIQFTTAVVNSGDKTKSNGKNAALILIYLEAVEKEDNLSVVYWDDNANAQINTNSIQIVVKENVTFTNALMKDGVLIGGKTSWPSNDPASTDYFPDNAYITNSSDVNQKINKEITNMSGIAAKYRSGIYDYVSADISEDGKTLTLHYDIKIKHKTFVVDFGLPVKGSLGGFGITDLTSVSDAGFSFDYSKSFKDNYGEAIMTTDSYEIQYTLKNILNGQVELPIYVKFVNDTEARKFAVTIIPASNVYYEDGFANFNNGQNTASKAKWEVVGKETTANQALSELGKDPYAYGYDPAYNKENSATFSMGSAHKVTVTSGMLTDWNNDSAWPTASFTFKGTGFDIISLTDGDSGAILVEVKNKNDGSVKNYLVNNYYGYELKGDKWVVDKNSTDCLYQIPVIKVTGLSYDEYTVTIKVFYDKAFDMRLDENYSFWLDAIRVYDPMGKEANYTADNEGYPQYIKLRDYVANNIGSVNSNLLFIDGVEKAEVAAYANYGPNNEVYLAKGQAISFKLPGGVNFAEVQIGAKAPAGESGMTVNSETPTGIASATEMYYDITSQAKNGQVTITNTTGNILSLTNIKITFSKPNAGVSLAPLSDSDAEAAVATVRALFAAPVDPEPTEPEQPEEPEKTFEPEHFETSWSSNVRKGGRAVLTVKASTDVDAIVVNGVTVTQFKTRTERIGYGWNAKRVTYREFVYMMTVNESGTLTVPVVAVSNEQGESNPYETTLTVKPSSPIRDWIGGLFGRWF